MSQETYMMFVRMGLQGLGWFLMSKNVFTQADWTAFTAPALIAAGAGWSLWARREAGLKASVSLIPGTMVVNSNNPNMIRLAANIATMPDVHSVISTPEVAAETVSSKVVSGTNTAPATP